MTKLNETLRKPIETIEDGKAWIEELHRQNLGFHFEDSPETIGNMVNGKWVDLFTKEEADVVRGQVQRLYGFDWGEYECPIGYALYVMGE